MPTILAITMKYNHMNRLLTTFLFALLLPAYLFAQEEPTGGEPTDTNKYIFSDYRSERLQDLGPRRKLKIANLLYERGSYLNAQMYYEEVHAEKPNNVCVIARLAKINYLMRDYKEAEKWYKLFYEQDPVKYSKAKYMEAMMQKYNGNCDAASTNFQEFIDEYNDADNDKDKFKQYVKDQIAGCDLQTQTMNDPERVVVDLLDEMVNNPFSDYAPLPDGDNNLVFSSIRSDTAVHVSDDGTYAKSQIYTSTYDGNAWTKAKLFPEPVNDPNEHTGNATFTEDGNTMFFTRCQLGDKLQMDCSIYRSQLEDGSWNDPELVNGLNDLGTTNTHPSVGKDADGNPVLYFTSDREEGSKGKLDIYYAPLNDNGTVGTAKNASFINTEQNEVTPFYDNATNTLYFSSDKYTGIGGYDIYSTMYSDTGWSDPENLLAPINSSVDDIYFSISDDDRHGFLTSNRPGGYGLKSETCCDDIYSFNIIREFILRGIVATKADPETPIEDADLSYFKKDDGQLELITNLTTTGEPFYLTVDPDILYQANVTKQGYWGSEEELDFSDAEIDQDTIDYTFFIEPIPRRKIKLKRIYYDFDKYNVSRKYRVTLDSLAILLNDNPDWTVEVYGHTDSVGTDAYNMRLGKRRAQSVADYLVKKKINIDRISLISKGETVPLVPNSTDAGADDPKGRAKNRRAEFILNSNQEDLILDVEYTDQGPDNY